MSALPTGPNPGSALDPNRWKALALLATAQFMVILDTSIVTVALPALRTDLGFGAADLAWVINAYVLVFGAVLLLGGRAADLFGRRKVFLIGMAVFGITSLVAGFAQDDTTMIIARAAQGLGGAIVAPAALSIVTSLFTEARERNIAMSVWGGSAPAGGAAGVLLGGVFTDTIGWRWVFFVNVPVVLLVMLLAPVVLRRDESSARRARLDLPGAVSVTAGLFLAVFGIVQAEKSGFGSAGALGLLGGAVVLLAAFVVIEKNTAEPLVPLTIFRNRNLTVGSLVMLLLGAAWIPAWYFISLYMQTVLDFSALRTGLGYLPMTIGIFALSMLLVARTLGRFGFKLPLIVGLLALTAGTLAFSFAPDDGSYAAAVLPASLLLAIGMAFAYVPATVASLSAVTPETAGLASGLISTTYQIGSALGLAITAAVAAARTDGSDTVAALNSGYGTAFAATAIIAAVAILLALAIRKPGAAGPVAAGGSTEAAAQEEPSRA